MLLSRSGIIFPFRIRFCFNIPTAVLRSRSRSEPRFFGWSRSRFFLGRLRLPFMASENQNDLKMFVFHCILYVFLYNNLLINSTVPVLIDSTYRSVGLKLDTFFETEKINFSKVFSFFGQNLGYWSFYLLQFRFFKYSKYRIHNSNLNRCC